MSRNQSRNRKSSHCRKHGFSRDPLPWMRWVALVCLVTLMISVTGPPGYGQEFEGQTENPTGVVATNRMNRPEDSGDLFLLPGKTTKKPAPKEPEKLKPTQAVIPQREKSFSIDLGTAFRLAEIENPEIGIARQAIQEAVANQQRADVLLLPTIRAGANYRNHQGILQSTFGLMRSVNLSSLYAGGGAGPVGAGTVPIPMIQIFSPLADAFLEPLVARRQVSVQTAQAQATTNQTLLQVARTFLELIAAEAELAVNRSSERDMIELVELTKQFARAGLGRESDGNRAEADFLLLQIDIQASEEQVVVAGARLAEVLNLDPNIRLQTPVETIGVLTLVTPPFNQEDLIRAGQTARPEIAAANARIATAETRVKQEKVRPWLPTLSLSVSDGTFGGGTNRTDLVPINPSFGRFSNRTDVDLVAFWTVQNLGVGNDALRKERQATKDQAGQELRQTLYQVRREVIEAILETEASRKRIEIARLQIQSAEKGYQADLRRIRGGQGLPIELLNSMDRLVLARRVLVRALLAYNLSQFQLFVALGGKPLVPDSSN